jgi:hypothetical protein
MAITEDLKTLQELHDKRELTDVEYSAAKAAALKKEPQPQQTTAFKAGRSIGKMILPLLMLLASLLAFVWYHAGTKETGKMLATAVHAPIQLVSEVENVPASSWKAVSFAPTYAGTVAIAIRVVRGNPMDVFVANENQLDLIKSGAWQKVLVYSEFNAQKTQQYERSGQLQPGTYFLVLRDTSLGILSSSASDISINVQLKP